MKPKTNNFNQSNQRLHPHIVLSTSHPVHSQANETSHPTTMNPLIPTLGLASSLRTLRFPSTTRQIGQLKPFSSSTTQTFRSSALWSKRLTAVGLGSAAGLGLYAMAPTSSFSSFSPVRMAECECKSTVYPFLLSPLPDCELTAISYETPQPTRCEQTLKRTTSPRNPSCLLPNSPSEVFVGSAPECS